MFVTPAQAGVERKRTGRNPNFALEFGLELWLNIGPLGYQHCGQTK